MSSCTNRGNIARTMSMRSRTQRALLLGFISSIVCCGLAGIYCLLLGRFGQLEGRILTTTGAVAAAAILGLAAAVPWERHRWPPIGLLGFMATSLAFVLVLLAVWGDIDSAAPWFDKTMYLACVVAVALPYAGLLSLARLRRTYEWARVATVVSIVLLAAQISFTILAEVNEEPWFRAMGALAIVSVCGTLAVAVLHRVSAIRVREGIRTVELALSLTCPRCDRTQQLPVGRSKCVECGLRFSIEIEEEHCEKCGYPLYKLASAVCPECGTPISKAARPE